MSGKAKTRFVVRYNGVQKELVSVRESSSGELRIIPRLEAFDEFTSNGIIRRERVNRVHLSVHSSPNSSGTLIKFTKMRNNRDEHTATQFVRSGKEIIQNIVFAKLCPLLDHSYTLKSKGKDTVLELGSFTHQDHACLVYVVAVTNKPSLRTPAGFSCSFHPFENWVVSVHATFCNLPLRRYGSSSVPFTSPPRVNGIPNGDLAWLEQRALEDEEFLEEITQAALRCAERHRHRLIAESADLQLRLHLKNHAIWFHSTPESLARGRAERREIVFV